ncbi:hypothetical protein [Thermomonospora umbrina]|uniref:hypothetical protein n=1 Tax=Thermomonospora umbrina TaxID=111806 RepID=UPI0011C16B8E|nr:hypothetical protein [Thermomonospora umbrina]
MADGNVFVCALSPDVQAWLGLSVSLEIRPGSIAVNPAVGLRHPKLQEAYAELLGISTPRFFVNATFAEALVDIEPGPSSYQWVFAPGDDLMIEATSLAQDIERCGLDHFRSKVSLDGIIELLESSSGTLDEIERLAIAYGLAGDLPSAQAKLRALQEEEPEFEKDFVERFLRKFQS